MSKHVKETQIDRAILKAFKRKTPEELDAFIVQEAQRLAAEHVQAEMETQINDAIQAGFAVGYETSQNKVAQALKDVAGFGEMRATKVLDRINELNVIEQDNLDKQEAGEVPAE